MGSNRETRYCRPPALSGDYTLTYPRNNSVTWLRLLLIVALAVGIVLRTWQFRQIPPGLYCDEA